MRPLNLVFVLLLMAFSGSALAQSNAQQLGEANRVAMDAYNNLEIEVAKETLERAAANAERNGLSGTGLARTYANLGVVEIGGFGDASSALEAFVRALREDPNVEPDPLVSTPEVLQVFAQAKRRAGGSRSRSRTPPPPAMVEGNLEHVPAAEQLVNAPIPVYVANADDEVASMKIFYRSIGMKQPKSVQMARGRDGFSYTIPCEDVFTPKVEYFVLAFDSDGNRIGNAGSPENPVTVPIVSPVSASSATR
jgi:tetratricopeptide (TPR) repeat protein